MARRPIELAFGELWRGFDPEDNWFVKFLEQHFDIESSSDPEFLIHSELSPGWARHRRTRVFYTGENVRPDMRRCDWAFSFDHLDHERHFRLPLYRLYYEPERLVKSQRPRPSAESLLNRRFCNFVYSNPHGTERVRFLEKLSRYKPVDSGGAVMNNMGHRVGDKLSFLSAYKFTIAFENSSYPGYTTEKLADPMVADSVPIYWGNPVVGLDFNVGSFVEVTSLAAFDAAVEAVVELDRDDHAYLRLHEQPWFVGDQPNEYVATEQVVERFRTVFSTPITPVASTTAERRRTWTAPLRMHWREVASPTWRGHRSARG